MQRLCSCAAGRDQYAAQALGLYDGGEGRFGSDQDRPFGDNGYFLRALARDGNRSYKAAIDDYVTAVELFGNKDCISSVSYYKMARDYEQLGQFCDAMLPIEQWIALDPSRHETSQTQAMLSDYAAKDGCAAATSGGVETFPAPRSGGIVKCRSSSTTFPVPLSWIRAQHSWP
jgi:tetratricopeptide (TPR) repeat protein